MKFKDFCRAKLKEKKLTENAYIERLEYELNVIEELKFESIFAICYKIIKWAKEKDIRVGIGRGSAAGSLVCYALGITGLDPIKYDLQFERFLIRGRVSPPDIDMDFQDSRREEVYAYLESLLGKDRVAKICTFNIIRARSALRDVARATGVSVEEVDKIIKAIPYKIRKANTIEEIISHPDMLRHYSKYQDLFEIAKRLEGKPRHAGVHPAGVIISDRNIADLIPMQYSPKKKVAMTAWDMYDCEEAGLIKIDILGLMTLDIAEEVSRMIKDGGKQFPDIDNIEPNDKKVLKAFARGRTEAIFQFEKDYVQDLLKEIKVDSFKDLVALNALLRPGALAANAADIYAKRKFGTPFNYTHEDLKPILGNTYGLLVFQEQAMQIAQTIAGFSVSEADALRKAIAKTHAGTTESFRQDFFDGARTEGYKSNAISGIWRLLRGAGSYMFNKAHSTCYSFIAYQMMYLKIYYPTEFWTATLNSRLDDEKRLNHYIRYLTDHRFKILSPSIKDSESKFSPVEKKTIRAGFLRLKGIGPAAAKALEDLKDRSSFRAFIQSYATSGRAKINRSVLKILVDNESFRCYNIPANEVKSSLKNVLEPEEKKKSTLRETYILPDEENEYRSLHDLDDRKEA